MCKQHDWCKWIGLIGILFLGLQGMSMANMDQTAIQSSTGVIETSDANIWYKKFCNYSAIEKIFCYAIFYKFSN